VLEIAAGTGQHAAYLARAFPSLAWQPTDGDPEALVSIAAWTQAAPTPGMRAPLVLDVERSPWPLEHADAVLCINMIHISPWSATLALLDGAARVLPPGGVLFTYGPYKRGGAHTAESNAAFDVSLRARDPRWGVRDVGELEAAGAQVGLALERVVEMPANNLSLVLRRRAGV